MALLARVAALVLTLLAGICTVVQAQEMEVPVAVQMPLLLKVMAYDRQLRTRSGGTNVLGVAYQGGYRASVDVKEEAWRAASSIGELDGMPITLVAIDLDREDLATALAHNHATLLYVAPLRGLDIRDIITATRGAQVRTLTGMVQYVESGLAVGIRLRGDRPRIFVNQAASRLEGAELSAELLKLAQVF